jgi:hypothetical protein
VSRPVEVVLALIHDDGHVAWVADGVLDRVTLAATVLMLGHLDVPGWGAADMTVREAAERRAGYLQCRACPMDLRCGCPVSQAGRGMCPHGGYSLIQAAMDKVTSR